ncbi:MAG: type 1 glutamine amidotransferase [Rhizobiales bacterium]|nr:type 1 glutamine amidotransferase [Hyphomicrobiales bacterium]
MDAWQEQEHPWLVAEKWAIREAVLVRDMPYFGVCLGHQLLADALGGAVGPANHPEIGVIPVEMTAAGRRHPLLRDLPAMTDLLQWHLAEVKAVPADVEVLARSDVCAIHGISRGERVLGLQSHIEVSRATVREWLSLPPARAQLERHLGKAGASAFEADVERCMPAMNAAASRLYDRLLATIRPPSPRPRPAIAAEPFPERPRSR